MHLRPVIRSDLSEIADIAADAFYDDRFHQWLMPRAYEPENERARRSIYFERNKFRFADNNLVGLVCVEPSKEDSSKEELLGIAWWMRRGPSNSPTQKAYTGGSQDFQSWFERSVESPLTRWYEKWIAPNRLMDHERETKFLEMIKGHDWNSRIDTQWYRPLLCVKPSAQGKGAGSMLLKWGQDRADQEGIPATLEASEAGGQMYRKRGFRCVDWSHMDTAIHLKGGDCLIYDPKQKWTRVLLPGEQDYIDCSGDKRKIETAWKE